MRKILTQGILKQAIAPGNAPYNFSDNSFWERSGDLPSRINTVPNAQEANDGNVGIMEKQKTPITSIWQLHDLLIKARNNYHGNDLAAPVIQVMRQNMNLFNQKEFVEAFVEEIIDSFGMMKGKLWEPFGEESFHAVQQIYQQSPETIKSHLKVIVPNL